VQPKRHSMLEATLNTGSGFLLSYGAGFLVFPAFGFQVTPGQNFEIVLVYTVISVVRSYVWRRVFNWWQHGGQKWLQ